MAKLALVLALVVAACGGGDSTTTTAAPAGSGDDQQSTTAAPTTAAPTTTAAPVAANTDDEFCAFIAAYANEVETEFNIMSMSAAEIEAFFNDSLDAINQAEGLAPDDIRADVALFATAYGGFVEFLAENNFNFLAIAGTALDDPRLVALEDPALEEAGDRIEAYCGIENFITPNPAPPSSGGTGGLPGASVPEDFPSVLEPPGGVVVANVNVAGAVSVTFDTPTSTDEVIEYYTDILGPPIQQLDDPKGALWTTTYEGVFLNLVVADVGGAATQVNVSLGP
ncbi:MAG: hypothetical protein QNJ88_12940 [Acidimicrobiia bacterium]|nr:hypothetical protein [Acidimicrobiia bacterium]